MRYAILGFVDVVLGLIAATVTKPRRGTGMAVLWGVISFGFGLIGFAVWGIYMGISGRNRPAAGTY